jgi:hypothetical protein
MTRYDDKGVDLECCPRKGQSAVRACRRCGMNIEMRGLSEASGRFPFALAQVN